jgi:DNA-binding transcriptional MerR regulator
MNILHPSIRKARGSGRHRPRLYSLEDVIALSVANRLRKMGIPARRISRILSAVRANAKVKPRYLFTDGKTVFFKDDGGSVVNLLRQHEAAFALFLEPLYEEVERRSAQP